MRTCLKLSIYCTSISVYCFNVGHANVKVLIENGHKADLTLFLCQILEKIDKMQDKCRKVNGGMTEVVLVIDMDGLTFAKSTHFESKKLINIFNYIFSCCHCHIIGKQTLFKIILSVQVYNL